MTAETRWLVVAILLAILAPWPREQLVGLVILMLAAAALRWSRDLAR